MSKKQTKAQRLAAVMGLRGGVSYEVQSESATLLLHQAELLGQALKALSIVRMHPDSTVLEHNICANAITAIRNHLEAK